jgi:hypothetical protein
MFILCIGRAAKENTGAHGSGVQLIVRTSPSPAVPQKHYSTPNLLSQISRGPGQRPGCFQAFSELVFLCLKWGGEKLLAYSEQGPVIMAPNHGGRSLL